MVVHNPDSWCWEISAEINSWIWNRWWPFNFVFWSFVLQVLLLAQLSCCPLPAVLLTGLWGCPRIMAMTATRSSSSMAHRLWRFQMVLSQSIWKSPSWFQCGWGTGLEPRRKRQFCAIQTRQVCQYFSYKQSLCLVGFYVLWQRMWQCFLYLKVFLEFIWSWL